MQQVNFYNLDGNELIVFLRQVRGGDELHAAAPFAFPAEDRAQLESDLVVWPETLAQVTLLGGDRGEARQTRDDAAKRFRSAVRPARQWAKGAFPGDDERSVQYGLDTMPGRKLAEMLARGQAILRAASQEPPLEPAIPERLLTPIQAALVQLETGIDAYQRARAAHKKALQDRNALRKEIEARLRYLRQHLYTFMEQDDPVLLDYGFAR